MRTEPLGDLAVSRDAAREKGILGKTLVLIRKDLRIEMRARDTLPPMLAFAFAVTLVLAFAVPGDRPERITAPLIGAVPLVDVLAGFLWVTVLFAGLIGFARTFEVERTDRALDVILLAPVDRSGLFAAKAIANFVYILLVEAFLLPIFAILFRIDLGSSLGALVLVALLVNLGFTAVGTLFAALAAQTRSRELILPILALPALVPVFIAGVELSADLFAGGGLAAIAEKGWFGILIAFDVIFTVVGALAFEFVIE